jgi:UTP--glucose-1-phosphate uridylyltransferase
MGTRVASVTFGDLFPGTRPAGSSQRASRSMSEAGLRLAVEKMRAAGIDPSAVDVFTHGYRQLEAGASGLIREADIQPLPDVPHIDEVDVDLVEAREALSRTAIIKLNGGLGTSMGLRGAKTLLPLRGRATFLDLLIAQVRHARELHGVRLPLVFMHSFRTREDCLAVVERHPDLGVAGLPADFLQNREPKLLAADLTPVTWPDDPSLEWCPPGHGDLYTAVRSSGVLRALLEQGFRYASIANGDNLGAAPAARLAGWFAASGAPYAAEVCLRTPADRKGGHLAIRTSDSRLILRDTAQTAPDEMGFFTDERRHPYVHTNNLWLDLVALESELDSRGGVIGLPLIRNVKTVDPSDPSTPGVIQIETAMGAAIEVFPGAQAIAVDRGRFLPVKTTDDLLLLRSDAYEIGPDGVPRLTVPRAPLITLDSHFRTISYFDARFTHGPPSLRGARSLTVRGDWTFGAEVQVVGEARLMDTGSPERIPDGWLVDSSGAHPA